jgi:hypothetical protein
MSARFSLSCVASAGIFVAKNKFEATPNLNPTGLGAPNPEQQALTNSSL